MLPIIKLPDSVPRTLIILGNMAWLGSHVEAQAPSSVQRTQSEAVNRPQPASVRSAFELLGHFHERPDADKACVILEQMLKAGALSDPSFQERPDRFVILAHGYGHLARGQAERVRLFERFFVRVAKDTASQRFLLAALAVCADEDTPKALKAWRQNDSFQNVWAEIEEIQTALQEKSLKLPRDREPRLPLDLDLLWIDFYVTGEYPPIDKILGVLDRPDQLRARIESEISAKPQIQEVLLPLLKTLGMVDPENPAQLINVDLDYLASIRRPGAKPDVARALTAMNQELGLSRNDWVGFVMKGAANWSMTSNTRQHPRLAELLEDHLSERPPKSQAHIRIWIEPLSTKPTRAGRSK